MGAFKPKEKPLTDSFGNAQGTAVVERQTPQQADTRTASIGGGQLEQMVANGQTLDTLTPQEMAYLARQERNNGGVLPEDLYNAVYKNPSDDIDEVVVTGYRTQADRDWYAANFNSIGYTGPHKDYFPSKKPDYVAPQITKISLGKVLTQALGIGSLPAAGAFGVAGVGIAATSLATKLPILNEAGLLALEVGVGDAIGGASILRAGGAVIGLGAAGLKSLDNLAASHILQRTSNGSYLAESDFGVLTKAYEPSTLNIAGLESGHSFARSVTEGGTGRSVAGHGSYWSQDGFSIVPEGTSITLPREGISIADKTGRYIENGDWSGLMRAANVNERIANDIQGMTTWLPGATVPNYTLTKPNGLNIYSRSSSTNAPVTLNNLLSPNMGCVNWAACTVFID